jgi:hypothetical protein
VNGVLPRKPAKIAEIKRRKGKQPRRYPALEQRANAVRYYAKWTSEELHEKASRMAIRMLALHEVLYRQHGTAILSPTLIEQLNQLAQSFVPQKAQGWHPRRKEDEPGRPSGLLELAIRESEERR